MSSPYSWVTIGCNPHSRKIVWVDLIFNKLPPAILVNIDSACLPVVYFTSDNCWIGSSLYLEPSDSVIVYITSFKVALDKEKEIIA